MKYLIYVCALIILFSFVACANRNSEMASPVKTSSDSFLPAELVIKADSIDMLSRQDKPLGHFSIAKSGVIGFPIELSCTDSDISVTVDIGTILLAGNKRANTAINNPNNYVFEKSAEMYWSPFGQLSSSSDKLPNKSTMTIYFDLGKYDVEAEIEFNLGADNFYTATLKSNIHELYKT